MKYIPKFELDFKPAVVVHIERCHIALFHIYETSRWVYNSDRPNPLSNNRIPWINVEFPTAPTASDPATKHKLCLHNNDDIVRVEYDTDTDAASRMIITSCGKRLVGYHNKSQPNLYAFVQWKDVVDNSTRHR